MGDVRLAQATNDGMKFVNKAIFIMPLYQFHGICILLVAYKWHQCKVSVSEENETAKCPIVHSL